MDWLIEARNWVAGFALVFVIMGVYAVAVGARYNMVLGRWDRFKFRFNEFTSDNRIGLLAGVFVLGGAKQALLDARWWWAAFGLALGLFSLITAWRRLSPVALAKAPYPVSTGHRWAVVRWPALFLLVLVTLLLAGCNQPREESSPPTPTAERYDISVWHDDARRVTCWVVDDDIRAGRGGIACLPDQAFVQERRL